MVLDIQRARLLARPGRLFPHLVFLDEWVFFFFSPLSLFSLSFPTVCVRNGVGFLEMMRTIADGNNSN